MARGQKQRETVSGVSSVLSHLLLLLIELFTGNGLCNGLALGRESLADWSSLELRRVQTSWRRRHYHFHTSMKETWQMAAELKEILFTGTPNNATMTPRWFSYTKSLYFLLPAHFRNRSKNIVILLTIHENTSCSAFVFLTERICQTRTILNELAFLKTSAADTILKVTTKIYIHNTEIII